MTDSIDLTQQQRDVFDRVKVITGYTKDSQVIGLLIAFYTANYDNKDAIDRTNKLIRSGT